MWSTAPPHSHPHLQGHVGLQGLFGDTPLGICEGAGAVPHFQGIHPPPLGPVRTQAQKKAHEGRESRERKARTTELYSWPHILGPGPASDHGWSQLNRKLAGQGPLFCHSGLGLMVETGDYPQSPGNMQPLGRALSQKPPKKPRGVFNGLPQTGDREVVLL